MLVAGSHRSFPQESCTETETTSREMKEIVCRRRCIILSKLRKVVVEGMSGPILVSRMDDAERTGQGSKGPKTLRRKGRDR